MQCPKCSSPNVEKLAHYWQSLPAESPLRGTYAPPAEVASQAWIALLAVVGGIAIAVSGTVLFGLLVALGGLLFGAFNHANVERYRGAMAQWTAARICLACPGLF